MFLSDQIKLKLLILYCGSQWLLGFWNHTFAWTSWWVGKLFANICRIWDLAVKIQLYRPTRLVTYQSEGLRNSWCIVEPEGRGPIFHAQGGQFVVWCAVFLFGSTHSFSDRQEQRATGTCPYWVCLHSQLSVSLLTASDDESGAAGVWALENTHIQASIICRLRKSLQ